MCFCNGISVIDPLGKDRQTTEGINCQEKWQTTNKKLEFIGSPIRNMKVNYLLTKCQIHHKLYINVCCTIWHISITMGKDIYAQTCAAVRTSQPHKTCTRDLRNKGGEENDWSWSLMMQKPIIEVKFSCTSFMGRRNQLQLLLDVWELYVCHYFLNEYQCSCQLTNFTQINLMPNHLL